MEFNSIIYKVRHTYIIKKCNYIIDNKLVVIDAVTVRNTGHIPVQVIEDNYSKKISRKD